MKCGLAFNEHEMALLFRHGIVAHAFWNHEHFAFVELNRAAFHFNAKPALEDEEQLVFILMAMPGQRAVDLCHFDVSVVNFGDDTWRPQFGQ